MGIDWHAHAARYRRTARENARLLQRAYDALAASEAREARAVEALRASVDWNEANRAMQELTRRFDDGDLISYDEHRHIADSLKATYERSTTLTTAVLREHDAATAEGGQDE